MLSSAERSLVSSFETHNVTGLMMVTSINPKLYWGGGANLPPRQFFATAQKRLELDC